MRVIITDLFDIDIHIFTVIKFLFNLVVRFKYILYTLSIGSNDIYYMNINPKGNKCIWKTQIYFLNCR